MKIIYGTSNEAKRKQVEEFFKTKNIKVEILTLKEIGFTEETPENGTTFEENSLIKALAIRKYCDDHHLSEIIVTDDAGLCVDCLNGEPGVYSARYAGDHAPQEIVLKKLLDNMKNVEERRGATFVCVLTAIMPDGEEIVVRGETKGRIAKEAGTMGKLTYGPVFIPDGFSKVMNDLTDEEIGVTHRGKAFIELVARLKERGFC